MKRYKRIMSLALSVVMALLATLCFSGCFEEEELILSTYGDFIITQHNEIYDFSEEGLQKEYIIVPEKINGDYTRVYFSNRFLAEGTKPFTKSEKLKKVYFEVDLEDPDWVRVLRGKYITRADCFCDALQINVKAFYNSSAGSVFGTNVWWNYRLFITRINESLYFLANIEFMYNYEGAPNEGCYWIDDLETGETLSYMPKDPTREGYTFGGWYADSECTTPYDFTAPYVKKEVSIGDNTTEDRLYYLENYPTFIYAKWIEN